MNLCKIKTVLFDLDGTLLDTAPDLAFALNKLLELQGIVPLSLEKIKEVVSDGCQGLLALGLQIDESHPHYLMYRQQLLSLYQQHLSVSTKLFKGMAQVLDRLDQQGIQWGVVTNKQNSLAKQILINLNLAQRCICIIGGDVTPRPKPHPDSLLLACELSNSSPKQCVYIGDAERDIEAAKYAGMRCIAALYGYLRSGSTPEFWHADYYIDHPQDILHWIDKQASCCLI